MYSAWNMNNIHVILSFSLSVSTNYIVCCGHVTETAENIGYSCNMLREEMNDIFIVSANNPDDVRQELRSGEVTS
jgi:hypothetical protein